MTTTATTTATTTTRSRPVGGTLRKATKAEMAMAGIMTTNATSKELIQSKKDLERYGRSLKAAGWTIQTSSRKGYAELQLIRPDGVSIYRVGDLATRILSDIRLGTGVRAETDIDSVLTRIFKVYC